MASGAKPHESGASSYFVVYRFNDKEPIDTSDPSKIVAITRETGYLMPYEKGKVKYRYVVTAVESLSQRERGQDKESKIIKTTIYVNRPSLHQIYRLFLL